MNSIITHFKCSRAYRTDSSPVHLLWATEGASRVWLEELNQEDIERELTESGVLKVYPKKNTIYQLYADRGGKIEYDEVHIKVDIPSPQILYFLLEPSTAQRGEEVIIHWRIIGTKNVHLSFGKNRNALYGKHRFRAFSNKTFSIEIKTDTGISEKRDIHFKLTEKSKKWWSPLLLFNGGNYELPEVSELPAIDYTPKINGQQPSELIIFPEVQSKLPELERSSIYKRIINFLNN